MSRPNTSVRAAHADEGGQTIVLVALLFVVLLGFAALSLDVGRFYAERRYLQNAVDSAALACARTYGQGGATAAQNAWTAADNTLQLFNLRSDPIGATITYPAMGSETYANNVVTDQNLTGGILPIASPTGCRVAITASVDTIFIKVVQPSIPRIAMVTKAYATSKGGFLPSVAYKYSNGPGPGDGSTSNFINWTMQGPTDLTNGATGKDWNCTTTSDTGCLGATPTNPGRVHVLFGEDAKATNDSNFRGYIALDVRDFQTTDGATPPNLVHQTYNGVANNADVNTLKSFEATWISQGYPGPDICTVTPGSFDKCAEVAALSGASAGVFVSAYDQFFHVGDTILLQLYDGTVKTVPDFTMSAPGIAVPKNASIPSSVVAYTMNSQFAASTSVIGTELYYDDGTVTNGPGDPSGSNPFMTGVISPCTDTSPPAGRHSCGTFSLNPTPSNSTSYNQSWSGMTASSAAVKGIYLAFLRGNATAPYDTRQHDSLVTLTVDGQTHDFNLGSSGTAVSVATAGTQADFPIQVRDGSGSSSWNGGANSITLTWERCPSVIDVVSGLPTAVLACKINGSAATTSVTTDVGSGSTVQATFNVDTALASPNTAYTGWIRAYGLDGSHAPVNHLYQAIVDVGITSSGGVQTYIDIIGYAAFQITAVTSNDVSGKAVSPAVYDPNDPLLALAKKFRLVPWETP